MAQKVILVLLFSIKVKDLLLVYAKKMKMNPDKFYFLNNGLRLNINEEKDLISFDLDKSNTIVFF